MSFKKRWRVIVAAFTQTWVTFTCPCGAQAYVSDGAGKLLDGQLCEACEVKEFEKWMQNKGVA